MQCESVGPRSSSCFIVVNRFLGGSLLQGLAQRLAAEIVLLAVSIKGLR